jgi:hypothetical protein
MSVSRQISRALLIGPLLDLGPNIVPFDIAGQTGVTICLNKGDTPVKSLSDLSVPDREIAEFGARLSDVFPASLKKLDGASVHFYSCQKIEPVAKSADRNHILIDHGQTESAGFDGLFTFYPGKFTAAPIVSRECADAIESRWQESQRQNTNSSTSSAELDVAKQKFLEQGAYTASVRRGALHFRKRRR